MQDTHRLWLYVADDVGAAIRVWAQDEHRSIGSIVSLPVTHALIDVGRYPIKAADAKTAIDLIRDIRRATGS